MLAWFEKINASHKYTIITCAIVFVADVFAIAFTWTEALSLLPLSASIVFLLSLSFRGVLITKIGTLYTNTAYIIYLSLIGSYVAIACQCILLCGAIIGLVSTIKDMKTKKQIAEKYKNLTPTILKRAKIKISYPKAELTLSGK